MKLLTKTNHFYIWIKQNETKHNTTQQLEFLQNFRTASKEEVGIFCGFLLPPIESRFYFIIAGSLEKKFLLEVS